MSSSDSDTNFLRNVPALNHSPSYEFELKPMDPSVCSKFAVKAYFDPIDLGDLGKVKALPQLEPLEAQFLNTFCSASDDPNHPKNIFKACRNFGIMRELAQYEKPAQYIGEPVNKFCEICQEQFSDYLEHINSIGHEFIIGLHPVNAYIQDVRGTVAGWNKSNQQAKKKSVILIDE